MRNSAICQYADCLNDTENGVVVTLRTKTSYDETKAQFCCAAHASAALFRLAMDRGEAAVDIPRTWKVN
jgi:hypothetical protein